MSIRRCQFALVSILLLPLIVQALILEPVPLAAHARIGNGMIGPANPILIDTNGDGRPTPGVDGEVNLTRSDNVVTLMSPFECSRAADTDNSVTLGTPVSGVYTTLTRVADYGRTQQLVLVADESDDPLGARTFNFTEKLPDNTQVGDGSMMLLDTNSDFVVDTIDGNVQTDRHGMAFSLSLVTQDVTADSKPDFISVPWSAAAFDMEPDRMCPLPAAGGQTPQIWLPIADTDGDGVGDRVVLDLNNDNLPDDDLYTGPQVAAGPARSTVGVASTISVNEGTGANTNLAVNVTLTPQSAEVVTVNYQTLGRTATAPGDYTATAGTLTFNPGDTLKTVDISIAGDAAVEATEIFLFELNTVVNASLAPGMSTITIVDNDTQVTISDVAQLEGNAGTSNAVFTVSLGAPSPGGVTVQYATAPGTAAAPLDYTTTAGTLTFNLGETSKPIPVPILGDTVFEANETFFVNLTAPVGATIADAQGLGTIQNDDPLTVVINDASQAEGNSGAANMTFTATLSAPSPGGVSVQYATAPGTAAAPLDYTATAGTLTFAVGETSKPILVPILGDTVFEATETFFVNLTAPVNVTIADNQGIGTITNDDALTVAIDDVSQAEGNSGAANMTFTATLSAPSPGGVSVQYATAPGTAAAPLDYTATAGTLTFAVGETSKPILVPILGDTVFEANETFFVNLTAPVNVTIADNQGIGTITNDDALTVAIDDVSQAEGNSGAANMTFTATLSAPSPGGVTVQYATAPGTAAAPLDYTATAGTLTFAVGETSKPILVPILGDTVFEATETFAVNLSTPVNVTIADNQGIGTIQNDDVLTVAINDVSQVEGNSGAANLTFTATLSAPSPGGVTVQYATAPGTAAAPLDYTTTAGTVTFAVGETSKPILVPILGDTVFEADETFAVNLSAAVNVTIADTQGIGTITNDDRKLYTLAEGATGPFFTTKILLANPDPVAKTPVLTFITPTILSPDGQADSTTPGVTVTQNVTVPPLSQVTVVVDDIPGLSNTAVSTRVDVGGERLIVERTMTWDATQYGAHTESAQYEPGTKWYFAEGSQGYFDTYLMIGNFETVASNVTVRCLREDGVVVTRAVVVPSNTRLTFYAGAVPELIGQSFSIVVDADSPVSAERAMYFGPARLFDGGHASAGTPSLATTWFHAEGATGPFFDTFILVGNPNPAPTEVTLTFLRPSGAPVVIQRTIPANSRLTLNIEAVSPLLADTAVSTRIVSTLPVVTERSQYWAGAFQTWYEGHTSFGVSSTGTEWGLAEGLVGGSLNAETFILLSNPDPGAAATVDITFLRALGAPTVVRTFTVPPNSRLTVHVNRDVPALVNEPFGAFIRSNVPIFVDRSLYWSVGGQVWAAGTSASAVKLQ